MNTQSLSVHPEFVIPDWGYSKSPDFTMSPFRYPGGKYYGLKFILPFLTSVPHDEYREPFAGGGCVFFGKPKSNINWLNDLDSDVMNVYRVIANPALRKRMKTKVSREVANRDRHNDVKNMNPTSVLEKAFKTYYLNRTSYSGIINKAAWGYAEGKSSPPENWGRFIEYAGKKLEGVKLTSEDFPKVITAEPRGKIVLMYLDPPYFHADQKRAYTKSFIEEDHYRLAPLLKKTNYLFCLSYDDCREIRELYKWAEIHERSWFYNSDKCIGTARKQGNELIITNYKIRLESLFNNSYLK